MTELLVTPYQWRSYVRGERIRILMYHSISHDPADPLSVRPELFQEQMSMLGESGCTVVPLARGLEQLGRGTVRPRTVCLTFDDGLLDFHTTAMPILERHGFSATLFVVAGCIGGASRWSSFRKNRLLMGWPELRDAVRAGHTVGSHSLSHPDLRALPPDGLRSEVEDSRKHLEDHLQQPIDYFAYPGGTFSQREVEAVARARYSGAVIAGGRWGNGRDTPRLTLKREKMLSSDRAYDFTRKVGRFYELFYLWSRLAELTARRNESRYLRAMIGQA